MNPTKSFTINREIGNQILNIKKIKNIKYESIIKEFFKNKDIIGIIKNTKYIHQDLKSITVPLVKEYVKLSNEIHCSMSRIIGVIFYEYIDNIKINEPEIYNTALDNSKTQDFLLKKNPKRKYTQKYREQIIKKDFNNFQYEEKEQQLLNQNLNLTNEDISKINKLKTLHKTREYFNYVEDMYVLYVKYSYSTTDIGIVYGLSPRTIQTILKKCDIIKSLSEAQQIAKRKRNYKEIQLKGRQTMLDNNTTIEGSKQEQYTRESLNCILPIKFPNCEIIVGLNNKSILDNGKEIDIPVIIINNDKIFKFAIEYNGDFWHKDENRDIEKIEMVNQKGYHLFYIAPKENATNKQIKEHIENEINNNIIPYIKTKLKEFE